MKHERLDRATYTLVVTLHDKPQVRRLNWSQKNPAILLQAYKREFV